MAKPKNSAAATATAIKLTMPNKPHNAAERVTAEWSALLLAFLAEKLKRFGSSNKVGNWPIEYWQGVASVDCTAWAKVASSKTGNVVKGEVARVARGLQLLIADGKFSPGITTFSQCGSRNSSGHETRLDLTREQRKVIAVISDELGADFNGRTRYGVLTAYQKAGHSVEHANQRAAELLQAEIDAKAKDNSSE